MPRYLLAIPIVSLLTLACEPSASDDAFQDALQGTWVSCSTVGTTDQGERLTFTGDGLEWTVSTFSTADGSCGGTEAVVSHLRGAFVVSSELEATLRGARVIARGLDVMDASRTFYTTVYVDQAASPPVLYLGLADPSTDRDMTSGAKRPVVLGATPLLALR